MLSIVLGQCNWKENNISFGSSCFARELSSNDLIIINKERIKVPRLRNDYYTQYKRMLNDVIRSKMDVDRNYFDFYRDDKDFSTVREALFHMHGIF